MSLSEKWEKLIIFAVFFSGMFLVVGGLYLAQIPADSVVAEEDFSETSALEVTGPDAVVLYSEAWCDAMMEKPNSEWEGDDFVSFSRHCLNPEVEKDNAEDNNGVDGTVVSVPKE